MTDCATWILSTRETNQSIKKQALKSMSTEKYHLLNQNHSKSN